MNGQPKKWAKGIRITQKIVNGKSLIKQSINVPQFIGWLNENQNERGYVNLDCWEIEPERSKFGETHNAYLNEWVAPNRTESDRSDSPF